MPPPAPRRQRLEHDERRAQILACARQLFSEHNYDAVSTAEIAQQAGVARGLLHHYFGTKRDLYLEVVRTLMRMPSNPVPAEEAVADPREAIADSVDRWLAMLDRNRGTWLAAMGARGLGRDREVEAILEAAREGASDRLVAVLGYTQPADAPPRLRAALRAYGGFAESASVQWLERDRLSREELRELLISGFFAIVGCVAEVAKVAEVAAET